MKAAPALIPLLLALTVGLGAAQPSWAQPTSPTRGRRALSTEDLVLAAVREALAQRLLGVRLAPAPGGPPLVGAERAYAGRLLAALDTLLAAPDVPAPLVQDVTVAVDALLDAPAGRVDAAVEAALTRLEGARAGATAPAARRIDLPLGVPAAPELNVPAPGPASGSAPRFALQGPGRLLLEVLRNAPHGIEPAVGDVIGAYTRGMNTFERVLPPVLPFALTLPRALALDSGQGSRFVIPAGAVFRQRNGVYVIDAPGLLIETPDRAILARRATLRLGNGADGVRLKELAVASGQTGVLLEELEGTIDRRAGVALLSADRAIVDTRPGTASASRIVLEGARIEHSPGALRIEAARLDARSADLRLRGTDFSLEHVVDGGGPDGGAARSSLSARISDLESEGGGVRFEAGALRADVVREAGRPDRLHLLGEDLNLESGGTRLVGVDAELTQDADGNLLIEATGDAVRLSLPMAGQPGWLELGAGARVRIEESAAGLALSGAGGEVALLVGGERHRATDVTLELRQGADGQLDLFTRAANADVALGAGRRLRVTDGDARLLVNAAGDLRVEAEAGAAVLTLSDGGRVRLDDGARATFTRTPAGWTLTGEAGEVDALLGGRRHRATGVALDLRQGVDGALAVHAVASRAEVALDAGRSVRVREGEARLFRDAAGGLRVEAHADGAVIALGGEGEGGGEVRLDGGARATLVSAAGALALTGHAGEVRWAGPGGELEASGVTLLLERDVDGALRAASTVSSGRLVLADGRSAEVTDGAARLFLDAEGDLHVEATAEAATVRLPGGASLRLSQGASASLVQDGEALALTGSGGQVDLLLDGRRHRASGAVIALRRASDGALSVDGAVERASLELGGGRTLALTRGVARFEQGADGRVRVRALTDGAQVDLGNGARLTLTAGAELDLEVDAAGAARLTTRVGSASLTTAAGEQLDVVGLDATVRLGPDDQLLSADLARGAYHRAGTHLELADAHLVLRRDGDATALDLRAAEVAFSSLDPSGQVHRLELADAHLQVRQGSSGAELSFSAEGSGRLLLQGHELAIGGLPDGARWAASVRTGSDGALRELDLDLPGTVRLVEREGRLRLEAVGLSARVRDGSDVRIAFSELGAELEAEGITARAHDGLLTIDDRHVALHVGDAEVLRRIGDELGIEGRITGLDLLLARGADGGLRSLDLALQELELDHHVEGLSVRLVSPDGAATRLRLSTDASGQLLEELAFEVPSGAELRVSRGDELDLTLGPQSLRLTRRTNGEYRLRAEDLNVAGRWRDVTARAEGELLDVSLGVGPDGRHGLVFHDVTATRIDVAMGGRSIELDVAELDDVLLRLTGTPGLTQGASLRLVPTSADSRISLEVRADLDGLPITLELDDLRELEALASVRENEVRVLAHDPSGRGRVTLGVGPVQVEGIGFRAAYQPFSSDLLLASVGQLLSREGVALTRALSVEPDGVVRAGLPASWPVRTELAVSLPFGREGVRERLGARDDAASERRAIGIAGTLEAGGTDRAGTRTVGRLSAGLSPASSLVLDQTHGTTRVFGVRAPGRIELPTTPFASLGFARYSDRQRLDLELGAFANPAAFSPAALPIREPVLGGVYGGVRLVRRSSGGDLLTASLSAAAELGPSGDLRAPSARLTIGIPLGRRR